MSERARNLEYRAFREAILKECGTAQSKFTPAYGDDAPHPMTERRARLAAYQSHLRFYAREMMRANPATEPHIRRALGISPLLPLVPAKRTLAAIIGLVFLPDRVSLRRARQLLGRARRLEGRKYIFEQFVRYSFPGTTSQWHYSPSLDHLIRHYELKQLGDDLRDIQHLDAGLLRAGTALGLQTVEQIKQYLLPKRMGVSGSLVLLLVEEGVVQAPEELSWVAGRKREYYQPSLASVELSRVRQLIRVLWANGVSRQLIAGVFSHNIDQFNPELLEKNAQILSDAGIVDLSVVFVSVNDLLWRAATSRWQFLVEIVGVKRAQDVEPFRSLLESHRNLLPEMITALQRLGADLHGLATCLPMLLATARYEDSAPPLNELRLLVSAEHRMTIAQLGQCERYLDSRRDLAGFLAVLSSHDFGMAASVLAFQRCYGDVSAASLDRLLTIVSHRRRGVPVEEVADWVLLAGKGGYYHSFEYLVTAIPMRGMASLQQAVKLSTLGAPLLRYLVEDQKFETLKAIHDWYYNDAKGIQGYHAWGTYDELDRILLNDAFQRKNFILMEANQRCIARALGDRVISLVGQFPYQEDETTKAVYRGYQEKIRERESEPLRFVLPSLLQRTGGVLLNSLLKTAWSDPTELTAQLNLMAPLLDDLMAGRGPIHSTLSELEADAIALLYRTTVHTVTSTWPSVIGRERDLAHLTLRDHYAMGWQRVQWQLTRPLDRRGLCALVSASEFAQSVKGCSDTDMTILCKPLLSKRLSEPSADITTLVHHLGMLLAVAGGDMVVAEWRSRGFEDLTQIDEESLQAYQRIESLQTLFETSLPDALDAAQEEFARGFSDSGAAVLAARLDRNATRVTGADGRTQLSVALTSTRRKVLAVYGKWIKRELAKFRREKSVERSIAQMVAVVTKHPAAFFAKETAKLCTRHNVQMWGEERHSHLVVFDPAGKCIVGMAMIYMEVLPQISPDRPSLVIRAMNPTDESMASYSVASMVDAFFETAIQVAEDNGLACVAFPTDAGMHLLSNHPAVEKDINTHFVRRSTRLSHRQDNRDSRMIGSLRSVQATRMDVPFEAYEQGQNKVSTLYVIWQAESSV